MEQKFNVYSHNGIKLEISKIITASVSEQYGIDEKIDK